MSVLGRRYAAALRESAGPSEGNRILEDLEAVLEAFQREPALRRVLESPAISPAEKESLARKTSATLKIPLAAITIDHTTSTHVRAREFRTTE